MVNQRIKDILLTAIITALITGLLSPFIISYLNSTGPYFFLDDSNNYGFNKDKVDTLNINLYNKGNDIGFANLCLYSREFVIKNDNGYFEHQYCFKETKIPTKSTDLMITFQPSVKPDANIFSSVENGSIIIDVTCSQKVWSLFPKDCDRVTKIQNYRKEGDRFNKIT